MSRCYGTCWTLPPLSGTKSTFSVSCGTERSKAPRCPQIYDLLDNDENGFEGDVFEADTGRLEGKYKGVLGASTAQQVIGKTPKRGSRFHAQRPVSRRVKHVGHGTPGPPGFRGNEDDGRVLKGVIRKDAYTVEWGARSRLEIVVGEQLRDRHNSPKAVSGWKSSATRTGPTTRTRAG